MTAPMNQCGEVLNSSSTMDSGLLYMTVCTFTPRDEEHTHVTSHNTNIRILPLTTPVVERNGHSYVASTVTMLDLFVDIPVGGWGTPNLEVLILRLIGEIEDLQERVNELETELEDHDANEHRGVYADMDDRTRELEVMIEDHSHDVSFN